ncbi:MAG: Amidohydrolase family protein [Sphingomonas bacterium]|uniref:amidohydrolase family protein n=1 Tax=Sphingomonas bacterium TaxID=1895847 RepID=UPI00261E93B5|nr:amidohydrolase family protein [Sphingomonas bacterium]MDB5703633.1 Amidohydrolase family protein [Sphingomonas bacterium]
MRFLIGLGLWAVALVSAAPASAETLAFTGATVIDGTGQAPIADGVVVVKDGRIVAVGPRRGTAIPAGATRIDVSGKTIMPGIVNAHGHLFFDATSAVPARTQLADQLALYARYGVTTVFRLGDDGVESVSLRDALRRSAAPGMARLYVAGPVLNAKDPVEGRAKVTANAARGVDIIKIRLEGPPDAPIRTPAVYGAMIAQAHAEKRRIAVHMFTADETKGVVEAGADILAHSIRDRDADPTLIAAIKSRGVGYIPTLTRDLSVFVYESTPAFVSDPFFAREAAYRAPLALLMAPEAQAKVKASASAQAIKPALVQAERNLKLLSDAGVPIAMGTDTGAPTGRWQGYFEHLELEMMVDSGLTPMQALVAGSGGAAQVMRIDDAVGTLRPGRFADLLVLGKNPLTDIRNTRTLEQVWIGGRKLD